MGGVKVTDNYQSFGTVPMGFLILKNRELNCFCETQHPELVLQKIQSSQVHLSLAAWAGSAAASWGLRERGASW